jgi:hypothetical protein
MKKEEMLAIYERYIAEQMKCSVPDLHRGETFVIRDVSRSERYMKILSIGDTNIVTVSPELYDQALSLQDKSRDELYESELIFGQTIHYVPDLKQMEPMAYPDGYTYELLVGEEVQKLLGIEGFDNSLAFDENGITPTCIVLYARDNGKIVALAGASYETEELREVGVDVLKEYRGRKLASVLVRNLTVEILKRGKVPFYSASVTNIASQAVAIRSGYMPLWTDTFGTRAV